MASHLRGRLADRQVTQDLGLARGETPKEELALGTGVSVPDGAFGFVTRTIAGLAPGAITRILGTPVGGITGSDHLGLSARVTREPPRRTRR